MRYGSTSRNFDWAVEGLDMSASTCTFLPTHDPCYSCSIEQADPLWRFIYIAVYRLAWKYSA